MINYRVDDLHALVKVLREEGCNVLDKIEDSEYGKYLMVWKKTDGVWNIAAISFTSDAPAR